MALILPNTITNDIPADGDKLGQNFDTIMDWANQEAITRDGSTAMVNPLLLPGNPTQPNQAATKAYVDNWVPVGTIWMYGGAAAPEGWMLCQGQAISRATYAALFAVFGTLYGAGNGSTTFGLPSLVGRVPLGLYPGGTWGATLGLMAGSADATLPVHNHTGADHLHPVGLTTGTDSVNHTHDIDIGEVVILNPFTPTAAIVATATGPHKVSTLQTNGKDTVGHNQAHTHPVNGNTGGSDRTLTTSNAGASPTQANLQPYTVVNFMVKVL